VSSGIDKTESERRFPWRWRRVIFWALVALAAVWTLSVILEWLTDGDGLPELNLAGQEHPYLILWGFVTFDAVIPILPSESLLNAASTLASQGQLELGYIIVAGALGAIVGDSLMYWLARTVGRKIAAERLEKATDNPKVAVALEVFGETAPLLIVAGRFVPGVRFVVNGTMGLPDTHTRASSFGRYVARGCGLGTRARSPGGSARSSATGRFFRLPCPR